MRTAVYPGSFDPVTNGHLDIISRGLKLFDRVIVAVLVNREKNTMFTVGERMEMISEATRNMLSERIEITSFDGLLVNYVRERGADAILRGIRAISDFEYEFQMALMNRKLLKQVDTVFMMPDERYSYLSSKLVREVASFGGDVSVFVPGFVEKRLKTKCGGRPDV
ncbi:MAG: pantetheine-phosphate adenylyltransferase [Acidobacteria bacterium]|nr:MAG: pantetheine-phosphate adenylyltransferase [Acidobacteriota bacterium]RLE22992.1 MAG: pantetheine-phosphate adenylyltransferase [Acidobacteriota bacterium]